MIRIPNYGIVDKIVLLIVLNFEKIWNFVCLDFLSYFVRLLTQKFCSLLIHEIYPKMKSGGNQQPFSKDTQSKLLTIIVWQCQFWILQHGKVDVMEQFTKWLPWPAASENVQQIFTEEKPPELKNRAWKMNSFTVS